MLRDLAKKLGIVTRESKNFDPSTIEDPLAMKIKWTPAKSGGASFSTHRLVRPTTERLEFQPSAGAKIFYLLFIVIGLGLLIYFSFVGIVGSSEDVFVPIFVGFIFALVGGVMFYTGTIPVIFDKGRSYFWKNRQGPEKSAHHGAVKDVIRLDKIHALQLVSEYCRSNKSSFYSYELNLVLTSGKRINVVDHGSIDELRRDARTLAAFLDVPVWDAT
jgi:hypothetical protein